MDIYFHFLAEYTNALDPLVVTLFVTGVVAVGVIWFRGRQK